MLLFCRRMCHQLLLASNCFLSTSFLQIGLSISPHCYCDLLVNCTNHFFLKSALCSSTSMSHRRLCLILVELHKRRSRFHICVGISFKSSSRAVSNLGQKGQYRLSSTWWCSVLWDVVLPVLVFFWINIELKLLNYCLLPLSGQKLFQPKHDACFFVTTKLCITPFISRWKHMVLLRPLSLELFMLFVKLVPLVKLSNATLRINYLILVQNCNTC